jgi:hypothetical protein
MCCYTCTALPIDIEMLYGICILCGFRLMLNSMCAL